jgi:hypothetical protein
MHEGRRFLLALALVGTCVAIAGFFVATTPPVTWPAAAAVRGMPPGQSRGLPPLPMPQWTDGWVSGRAEPARRDAPAAASDVRHAVSPPDPAPLEVSVAAIGEPALAQPSFATTPLRAASPLPAVSLPPASDYPVVEAHHPVVQPQDHGRDRDPVTGAFATVGAGVGKGVRSVGRTLKNLF